METQTFEVPCTDGVKLNGKLFIPAQPKAVIQFNCGTATPMKFYVPFIEYLTENDYLCCLWNYRGSEQSNELKGCDYRYLDYGTKDMPAIKNFLNNKFPELPLIIIGHSTGGQQIGFMENLDNVKGNINFATSAGYYPNMPFGYRMKAYFFFYFFSPVSAWLNGYVKAKPYGLMENLPKKVVYEWRAWCAKKDYFFDRKFYGKTIPEGHFKDFKFPIHVYYSTDDTISNRRNTKNYWEHVKSEQGITFTEMIPNEFGLKKINHFGYFKKRMKEKLWSDVLKRLDNLIKS